MRVASAYESGAIVMGRSGGRIVIDDDDIERLRAIAEDEDRPLRDRAACALVVACDGDSAVKVSFGDVAAIIGESPVLIAAALAAVSDDADMKDGEPPSRGPSDA